MSQHFKFNKNFEKVLIKFKILVYLSVLPDAQFYVCNIKKVVSILNIINAVTTHSAGHLIIYQYILIFSNHGFHEKTLGM